MPPHLEVVWRLISELKQNQRNARIHTKKQIRRIVESMRRFGFVVPILINADGTITAGHGRWEAAKILGLKEVPTICLSHLNEAEIIALMIADNRLTETSTWDERLLGEQLKELAALNLDFSIEVTGFEMPEIDLLIQGLSPAVDGPDPADRLPAEDATSVTQVGDLWLLDRHRVQCADAQQRESFANLMGTAIAAMVFTDPPYNVPIDGHASGKGAVKHPDFVMASGELSRDEFSAFLLAVFSLLAKYVKDGALAFIFMDWRHMSEVLAAGEKAFSELKNLCIWMKDRAGMGSLYRSQHELVFVFKNGTAAHVNNIQLGSFGRYRTNIWDYPSAVSFGRSGDEGNVLANHPTPKPVALLADAVLDCSQRGDIILDPFLGSGTTVIAAEKTGRVCYGMEIDPKYVDVIVRRWQMFSGQKAVNIRSGRTFGEIEEELKNA